MSEVAFEESLGADLEGLVARIHAASLSPEHLVPTIQAIADALDADAGVLLLQDGRHARLSVNVMTGRINSKDAAARFEQELAFCPESPLSADIVTELDRPTATPLWKAALGNVAEYGLTVAVGERGLLGLFRSAAKSPFDDRACAQLQTLATRIQTALNLLGRLADAESQHTVSAGLLNLMATPLAVVEGSGHLVFANDNAQRLLTEKCGLVLTGQGTLALDPAIVPLLRTQQRFADLLALTAQAALAGKVSVSGLVLPRAGGLGPLRVAFHAMMQRTSFLSGHKPLVALHLTAGEQPLTIPAELLRGLFALTPAEANLLQALVQDKRLEDYADERGVSVTTVRTQLAHLFRKTGTNRQSELVRLALLSAGVLGMGTE